MLSVISLPFVKPLCSGDIIKGRMGVNLSVKILEMILTLKLQKLIGCVSLKDFR